MKEAQEMKKTQENPLALEKKTPVFTTKTLVQMALFTALLCVSAYVSIPLPLPGAPHITLNNFMILLIALLFPCAQSLLIILAWMLLGIVGLPVYIAGRSGIGYLLSGWGGYTLVFPFAALLTAVSRGGTYHRFRYTVAAVLGALTIDLLGMFWLMLMTKINLPAGIATGFLPFLPLDILKSVVAAQLVPAFLRVMKE